MNGLAWYGLNGIATSLAKGEALLQSFNMPRPELLSVLPCQNILKYRQKAIQDSIFV